MENRLRGFFGWAAEHRERGLDLVRIYLGMALFVRGTMLLSNPSLIQAWMADAKWFWPAAIAHYVMLAHLCGGLMLAAGLLTRGAAAAQLPALIGAVFFVHLREGFMSAGQSLELSSLVLFLLAVISVFGAGPLSLDHYFFGARRGLERPAHT